MIAPMMDTQHIEHFKEKLLAEKTKLEGELKSIGQQNPSNPADWVPVVDEADTNAIDPIDRADAMEDLEENAEIINQLEVQLLSVNEALKRIDDGTYGICTVGGEPISPERLEANPAAKTCIAHGDENK